MRVLIAGDTHGDIRWAAHLTSVAADHGASVVLQVGDFGFWPRMDHNGQSHAEQFLGRISADCKAYGVQEWIVLDGNHDDHSELSLIAGKGTDSDGLVPLAERIRYAPRGTRIALGGARIGMLGGAASIDAWLEHEGIVDFGGTPYRSGWNWFPAIEAPTAADVDLLAEGGDLDLLLSHDAPMQVDMRAYYGFRGLHIPPEIQARTDAVRDLVSEAAVRTRAPLIVHGHWHTRVRSVVEFPHGPCVVESLAANSARTGRDGRAYVFADLFSPSEQGIRITDGRNASSMHP